MVQGRWFLSKQANRADTNSGLDVFYAHTCACVYVCVRERERLKEGMWSRKWDKEIMYSFIKVLEIWRKWYLLGWIYRTIFTWYLCRPYGGWPSFICQHFSLESRACLQTDSIHFVFYELLPFQFFKLKYFHSFLNVWVLYVKGQGVLVKCSFLIIMCTLNSTCRIWLLSWFSLLTSSQVVLKSGLPVFLKMTHSQDSNQNFMQIIPTYKS